MQHQLDPSGNFISYRATLKAAIWRFEGAKQEAEKVIIPFFGLLIKDLFLLYRRCVMPLPNGHLNYAVSNLKKMFLYKEIGLRQFSGYTKKKNLEGGLLNLLLYLN